MFGNLIGATGSGKPSIIFVGITSRTIRRTVGLVIAKQSK